MLVWTFCRSPALKLRTISASRSERTCPTGLILSVRNAYLEFGNEIGSEGCSDDTVSGWAEVPAGAELVAVRSTSGNGVIHSLAFVWVGVPQPGECSKW